MKPAVEFEIKQLRRRLVREGIALGAVGMIAVVALAWSFSLGRVAAWRAERLEDVSARVDHMAHVAASQRQRIDPLEEHLTGLGTLEDRFKAELTAKADRASVAGVRRRLGDIAAHVARGDSLLAMLQGEMVRRTSELGAAHSDSLGALRRSVDAELAAIRDEARMQHRMLLALDLRAESLDEGRRRSHAGTVLRDGATLINTGMIVAHILDHTGR